MVQRNGIDDPSCPLGWEDIFAAVVRQAVQMYDSMVVTIILWEFSRITSLEHHKKVSAAVLSCPKYSYLWLNSQSGGATAYYSNLFQKAINSRGRNT